MDPVELPVDFTANRFFVTPVTDDGEIVRLYTDSGGGLFLFSESVARLRLPVNTIVDGGTEIKLATLPQFRPEASIPLPLSNNGAFPVIASTRSVAELLGGADGLLGQAWFSGRVWTWDYPNCRLLWHPSGNLPDAPTIHKVRLGFKTDEAGKRLLDFPRLTATIDHQQLDLLLDTGATVKLSQDALAAMDDNGPEEQGTSFIAAAHFDEWRGRHPEWRLIKNADMNLNGEPMIEVPAISLAGHTVGPVWFTRRPDPNFHEFMSRWMDRQVEGALGGSALRFFRVTVDYPRGIAGFERSTQER